MKYVYILQSLQYADRYYVGSTTNVEERLQRHNASEVPHTSKYKPWRVNTYMCFTNADRANSFEKYLKSGSGRAFAKNRL